jgi:beta-hydroxylase
LALWPLVRPRITFPPEDHPEVQPFLDRFDDLRDEVALALAARPAPPFRKAIPQPLVKDDRWGAVIVRLFGQDSAVNLERLPVLASLLASSATVVTAIVTILEPGAEVPWHPGIMKGVLRCHVTLEAPEGDIGMRVATRTLRWHEGEALVFDDTYPHRVWNHTDERRVIILLDLVRPMPWSWLERLNRRVIARIGASQSFRAAIARADRDATTV